MYVLAFLIIQQPLLSFFTSKPTWLFQDKVLFIVTTRNFV